MTWIDYKDVFPARCTCQAMEAIDASQMPQRQPVVICCCILGSVILGQGIATQQSSLVICTSKVSSLNTLSLVFQQF